MPVRRLVGLREGPARLVIARHAQSVGNVPDEKARKSGASRLDPDTRDADAELSETSRRQVDALRLWIANVAADFRPTLVLSSPYRRALEGPARCLRNASVRLASWRGSFRVRCLPS